MTINLDALEKLADEATPGEWTTYVSGAPEYNNVTHGIEIGEEGPLVVGAFEHEQDCTYVHAVQPNNIKALIAELKQAKKRVSRPEGEYRWKHIAQRAEASLGEASAIILGLAVELEGEVEGRYAEVKDHPAMARRYERDMDAVVQARAFLARNGEGE